MTETRANVIHLGEIYSEIGSDAVLVVIIISKSKPNFFFSSESNEHRGVATYTVRDSKHHLVNCKCWASKETIDTYYGEFHIGDVIDIIHARVIMHGTIINEQHQFQPRTTVPYSLVLNEGEGYFQRHNNADVDFLDVLRRYMHMPHKPLSSVLNLADVHCSLSDNHQQSQCVDLLVVVGALRPARSFKSTRNGQIIQCMELLVNDNSCIEGMILTIWNPDWIKRAEEYWQARKTILHLIDIRVSYSEFYKCPTLSTGNCTLIYENPVGKEAEALLQFASTALITDLDLFAQAGFENLPPADQIQTQMTVKQIYARAIGELKDTTTDNFTAVLNAMITTFDIDGQSHIISKKCKSCQRLIPRHHNECNNDTCQLEFSLNHSGDKFEYFFNINVQLSDHTGTLIEPRLSNTVAENIIGLDVNDFMRLSHVQKSQIKWRYLMNHFEVKLLVKKPGFMRHSLAIIIVTMRSLEVDELSEKLLVF